MIETVKESVVEIVDCLKRSWSADEHNWVRGRMAVWGDEPGASFVG